MLQLPVSMVTTEYWSIQGICKHIVRQYLTRFFEFFLLLILNPSHWVTHWTVTSVRQKTWLRTFTQEPQKRHIICDVLCVTAALLVSRPTVPSITNNGKVGERCAEIRCHDIDAQTSTHACVECSGCVTFTWCVPQTQLHSTRNRSVIHWTPNTMDQVLQLMIQGAVIMKVTACTTFTFYVQDIRYNGTNICRVLTVLQASVRNRL